MEIAFMTLSNIRKHRFSVLVLFCGCLLFGSGGCPAHAQATFVSIDAPGAGTGQGQGTFPLAINRSGVIVGYFTDASGMEHGFIRAANGAFTTVDVPGALGTQITTVNSLGLAAGYYYLATTTPGFLRYRNGAISILNDPGTSYTTPAAMNDSGQIAGDIGLSGGATRGFIWSATQSFKIVSYRYYAGTFVGVTGLNSSGVTVGSYSDHFDQRTFHAFVRDSAGDVTSFDATDSTKNTQASAINSSGQITGYYFDSSDSETQSFARGTDGTITLLALAGYQLYAVGINDGGLIAGTAYTASTATPFESDAAGNVTLLALPFNNLGNEVVAINKNGLVIGTYYDSDLIEHAWLMVP
jgi:hypothetical protein